jgi:hypothetical protein
MCQAFESKIGCLKVVWSCMIEKEECAVVDWKQGHCSAQH